MAPYIHSTLTNNHIIERIWVEVNERVTYPIKRVIAQMDERGVINMEGNVERFCVSYVLRRVCFVGLQRMINAWNNHPIPHKVYQMHSKQVGMEQLLLLLLIYHRKLMQLLHIGNREGH